MTSGVGLVIVAAGSSARMGGIDKVWAPLRGMPVVRHSIQSLAPHADRTVVVVRPDMLDQARRNLLSAFPGLVLVPGGAERRDSVLSGLEVIEGCEIAAIHDAARPLASARLLETGLTYLDRFSGAIPVLPVTDTVKRVDNEVIVETLDRSTLRLAQTPQLFRTSFLVDAHRHTRGMLLTDDASALEVAGGSVVGFPGDPWNLKITTPHDLELAEIALDQRLAI